MYFDHSSQTINEGARYRFSTYIRSFPSIGVCFPEINVKYSISAGPATAGSDFTPASGTVYMSETMSMVSLGVNIIDDSILEDDETVILTLLPGEGYDLGTRQKLGERTTNTLTIADDDTPRPSFADDAQVVSEAAGAANVTVNVSPPPPSATTLNYTVGGTATAGSEFTVANSVSLPAGATSVTIPVTIIDDSAGEDHETVILTLLPGTGYKPGGRSVHTLTIADNDTPQISFASAGRTVSEAAGTVNTRIDIAPALTSAMNLVYTVGGTANVEYAGIAGDAVFFLKNPLGEDDFRVIHPISVPPGVTTMDIVNNWRGGRCA